MLKQKKFYTIFFLLCSICTFAQDKVELSERKVMNAIYSDDAEEQKIAYNYLREKQPVEIRQKLTKKVLHSFSVEKKVKALNALKIYEAQNIIEDWEKIIDNSQNTTILCEAIYYSTTFHDSRIVPVIIEKLTYKYLDVRLAAAKALATIQDDRAFPIVLNMASSSNPVYRVYSLEAMYYLYDDRFYNFLLKLIKDENKSVRYHVLKCIEKNGIKDALPAVRKVGMNDDNWEVQIRAIEVLTSLKDKNGLYVLHHNLAHSEKDVRLASIKGILNIGNKNSAYPVSTQLLKETDDLNKELYLEALYKFKAIGNYRGVEHILLDDHNSHLRINAAYLIGYLKEKKCANALISVLKDSDFKVRAESANSLGFFVNPKSTKALLGCVKNDQNFYVRSAALYSLKKHNNRKIVKPLFNLYAKEKDLLFKDLLYQQINYYLGKYL